MIKRISYLLDEDDRGFPGAPTMRIEPFESMKKGDVLNTFNVTIFNHFGTHMDGPFHFNPNGCCLYEYEPEEFFFKKPVIIDIPKKKGELVESEDLQPFDAQIREADLLMIRTGFCNIRKSDNEGYAKEGPGISASCAERIVHNYADLKAVALDWISLCSPLHPFEGVRAHQIMLGKEGTRPILIIEDVDMRDLKQETLKRVIALPLYIKGTDSAPVTMVAEIEEE